MIPKHKEPKPQLEAFRLSDREKQRLADMANSLGVAKSELVRAGLDLIHAEYIKAAGNEAESKAT